MKYLWLLLALGCSGATRKPPVSPPIIPPAPAPVPQPMPVPQPIPPPEPPRDSVQLVIFPPRLVVAPSILSHFCLGWRFPNGHVVLGSIATRNLGAWDTTCGAEYLRWFDKAARAVTVDEEAAMGERIVTWISADTMVVGIKAGGFVPDTSQFEKWKAWSVSNPRVTHPYDSTEVIAQWKKQEVRGRVTVRTMGWYVAP